MKNFYVTQEFYFEAKWGEKEYLPIEECLQELGAFDDKEKAMKEMEIDPVCDFCEIKRTNDYDEDWKTRIVITVRDENGEIVAERTYKEEDYDF